MTSTLVQHRPHAASATSAQACERARDWAEIQERMLVPLYEAVYERLEVGAGSRVLGLGCGSGLALLIAAARGAAVSGTDTDRERLALARERMGVPGSAVSGARLYDGEAGAAADPGRPAYNLITVFQPIGCRAGDADGLGPALRGAVGLAERGSAVVLTGWGPPERCATSGVLRVAEGHAGRTRAEGGRWRPALRDDLEDVAARAGLRPDGSGRVACPFGYADVDSAIRGLLSTRLYDMAVAESDQAQVAKEIGEALHPHVRPDGTVWMPNVFRYLIARTP
ncbi:SAM-dependent methyltransferase [Streptomyces sp. ISL-10]|uniref:SAM-dependent methyltransferase n=1 Tax=Streptomyces sp. ISL-10 TaxID=2819172 RepID=UPI001BEBE102|nr:SAM-dependent methyltransferase [Streptomyces sp. ISL-10]MBT2364635.1 SAM-dependent methyltransferase [Streptomyces sp. ISL-10]